MLINSIQSSSLRRRSISRQSGKRLSSTNNRVYSSHARQRSVLRSLIRSPPSPSTPITPAPRPSLPIPNLVSRLNSLAMENRPAISMRLRHGCRRCSLYLSRHRSNMKRWTIEISISSTHSALQVVIRTFGMPTSMRRMANLTPLHARTTLAPVQALNCSTTNLASEASRHSCSSLLREGAQHQHTTIK